MSSRLQLSSLPAPVAGTRISRWWSAPILLVVFSASGCGSGFSSVKGQVLLDGQPLRRALVAFYPPQGRGATGRTDAEGRYELRYTDTQGGVPAGKYAVHITTAEDNEHKELVPAKYNAKSELAEEVKAGANEINFSLSSK